MEMLFLVITLSTVMWYVIDRFKPLWETWSFGKYVTIAVSAGFAFALSFGFNVDILYALSVVTEKSVIGIILTALIFMSGSSAVNEIVERIKGGY